MNKINRALFIIPLLLGVLFGNCKCKKDPDPEPTKPIVLLEDLKTYSYFKKGTYWVYKDSVSGIEDSVYVYSDTAYNYYNPGNPIVTPGNYMYYECVAHSYLDTYDYYYQIDMGYYGSYNTISTWRIRTKPGNYIGETFLMSNRFVDGAVTYPYTGTGAVYYKYFYNNLNIIGLNFINVVKFYDTKNASEYESPTNFYIAKNIGIVRKEKLDTIVTWNLIRHHIIQ